MFVKKRFNKIKEKSINVNYPKVSLGEKEHEIIYLFDKFGKPTVKRWMPNKIQPFDDFGEINYNNYYINY